MRRADSNVSKQWFLKTAGIAKPAIEAVEKEKIIFSPAKWKKEYFRWMYHIRDWCISRQLQEGLRIPAYYCDDCGRLMVEEEKPGKCDQCDATRITQDPDTLDTGFSSALWPFAALGWLDNSQDFKDFFPISLMPANPDMIFSRVARMIMMGIYLCKDIPFREVFINGMIRDEKGRKKSKTGHNAGDRDIPDIIARCGADALRFTFAALAAPGLDISFASRRVKGYKIFTNKIWHASRRVLMSLRGDEDFTVDFTKITDADRWILNGLNNTAVKANDLLDSYQIGRAHV
jgi:valyl-tRNA synthetase